MRTLNKNIVHLPNLYGVFFVLVNVKYPNININNKRMRRTVTICKALARAVVAN